MSILYSTKIMDTSRQDIMAKLVQKNKDFKLFSVPTHHVQPPEEDPITQVLAKLSLIDARLSKIEENIENLKSSRKPDKMCYELVDNTPQETPEAPKAPVAPKAVEVPKTPVAPKAAEVSKTPVAPKAAEMPKTPVVPKAAEMPKTPVVPKAAEMPKFPIATESPFMSKSLFSSDSPFMPKAPVMPGNPFAEGLKKFNLPVVGDWASQLAPKNPPTETAKPIGSNIQEQEDEDEKAPLEELPIENTCNMQTIVLKTGEEEEDVLFEERCKLYRFRDNEYKERGVGNLKLLKHRTTTEIRLIMRRDQIGLVCLNCWECRKVERVRETQVRWVAIDASDGEPRSTVFLARFKTPALVDTFISHLTQPRPEIELVSPQLDPALVDKARKLQLPDLFYHKLPNQEPCSGCDGCEKEDK